MNFENKMNLSKSKEPTMLRQIACLFDGDHFGEMALIDIEKKDDISELSPPKARKAHCIAAEICVILEVPHKASLQAYQASGAKDMKQRLEFLSKLPGFRMIDKNTLLPLASNLKVKKYRIGEFIVRQREMPSGLIVIRSGECVVGFEKQRKREFHNSVYTKLKPKEMSIHFNDYSHSRYEISEGFNSKTIRLKKSQATYTNDDGKEVEQYTTKRAFVNDILEKEEDPTGKKIITYKDFINF
jgi:CRP-like cAMP-binding protein